MEQVQTSKAAIEQLKLQAERAEREGHYGQVAEIRYGKVKDRLLKTTEPADETNSV